MPSYPDSGPRANPVKCSFKISLNATISPRLQPSSSLSRVPQKPVILASAAHSQHSSQSAALNTPIRSHSSPQTQAHLRQGELQPSCMAASMASISHGSLSPTWLGAGTTLHPAPQACPCSEPLSLLFPLLGTSFPSDLQALTHRCHQVFTQLSLCQEPSSVHNGRTPPSLSVSVLYLPSLQSLPTT